MSSLSIPRVGLLEMPIKWAHIKRGLPYFGVTSSRFYFPDIKELYANGVAPPVDDNLHDVFFQPTADMVPHLRDWVKDLADTDYMIVGRFGWTTHNLATDKLCHGVRFWFKDYHIAVLAKLTFL